MERLQILRQIAPEIVEIIEHRYMVLQNVYFLQPVGRRALAARLGWPERMVRKEIDFLREAGMLKSEPAGMMVTDFGVKALSGLEETIRKLHGLTELEHALARRLHLRKVIVVPGDSDQDETVKRGLARATARVLNAVLNDHDVLAVTGGTTLAEVANSLPSHHTERDLLVVPARGGLGEEVELQANSVAARIAERLGGRYRLLHVPDGLGEEALASIAVDPNIKQLLDIIRTARVVLHGIGNAEDMARRRGLAPQFMQLLQQENAVGEALGYYFTRDGRIVYTTRSVGLRLEDLEAAELVIAVGGGRSKAEAALAVLSTGHQHYYITDEAAARRMLAILGKQV
ncbi:MAG TPA: hypothetical protein GXZ82_14230 [Firmicutes bacterium]|jgi:central glycolytic genes regulator|nr:hypothetical protein [Bacillota bacterium]